MSVHRANAKRTTAQIVVLAMLLLSACAREVGTRPGVRIEHPTGENELVVRVDVIGGFMPPEARLQAFPQVSILGDGRIFVSGPQIEIYPPPAMVNPLVGKLDEDDFQEILSEAQDAGMLEEDRRIENDRVADASTYLFVINARGRTYRTEAYALFESETEEALEIRAFNEFLSKFSMKSTESWEPDRMQIVVFEPQPGEGTADVEPNRLEWPLASRPEEFGTSYEVPGLQAARCGVVEGDELRKLRESLKQATTITIWTSSEKEYRVVAAPVFPDQSGCHVQSV